MSKLFRGTTIECLAHFAEHSLPPKGSKEAGKAKLPLVEFVRVHPDTVSAWIYGRNVPLGEPLIKLRLFLEAVGYELVEYVHGTDHVSHKLAELLAYDILTPEEAREHLGFGDTHSVFRLARADSDTNTARTQKVERLYGEAGEELAKKKATLLSVLMRVPSIKIYVETDPPSTPVTQVAKGALDLEKQDPISIEVLAHLVLAITPLLERAVSETSREQRNELRKRTGSDGMFRLSKASSRLCSEKARELVNNHQQ